MSYFLASRRKQYQNNNTQDAPTIGCFQALNCYRAEYIYHDLNIKEIEYHKIEIR